MEISSRIQSLAIRGEVTRLQERLFESQKQIASFKKADTHGGLGVDAPISLALREKLAKIDAYERTISLGQTRMETMQQALDRVGTVADELRNEAIGGIYDDPQRLALVQSEAETALFETVNRLNVSIEGRFLFSGNKTQTPPMQSADKIINGDGFVKGVKQVMADRVAADNANGLGQLTIAQATNTVTLTDLDARLGLSIQTSANSTDGNISITAGTAFTDTTGSPPIAAGSRDTVAVQFTGTPTLDQATFIDVGLPDGTAFKVKMVAVDTVSDLTVNEQLPINDGDVITVEYVRSTTVPVADNNAAAFTLSLTSAVSSITQSTSMIAASEVQAGHDFFNADRPAVIDASGNLVYDSDTNPTAVRWYLGDQTTTPIEDSAVLRIDDGNIVKYGVRPDEEGLRDVIKGMAVMASATYDPKNATDVARYKDTLDRTLNNDGLISSTLKVSDIRGRLGLKEQILEQVSFEHERVRTLSITQLDRAEGIDEFTVANDIVLLQTQLQATYEITARLQGLTLVAFL